MRTHHLLKGGGNVAKWSPGGALWRTDLVLDSCIRSPDSCAARDRHMYRHVRLQGWLWRALRVVSAVHVWRASVEHRLKAVQLARTSVTTGQ